MPVGSCPPDASSAFVADAITEADGEAPGKSGVVSVLVRGCMADTIAGADGGAFIK